MKRCIQVVMRKIIGERAWVALKTKLRGVLPARMSSNHLSPDDFTRRIYARLAILESKANLLLYGAPAKDDFTLRALGTRDLDADNIAADFFTRYAVSISLAKRQRIQKQIKTLAPKIAKLNPRRMLDISCHGILDIAFLKQTFPQAEELLGQVPTDPVTAVQVLAEKQFDVIFCVGTLETLPPREQIQLLIRIVPLLAANGLLYLQLPYLFNPGVLADAFWENPDTLRPFSISLLEFLFEDQALQATQYAWDAQNRLIGNAKRNQAVTEVTYLIRKK